MMACYLNVIKKEAYHVQIQGITKSIKDNKLVPDSSLDCLYFLLSAPAGLRFILLPLQILAQAELWGLIRCGEV